MNVLLSPEMETLIKQKVASGYYRSPEDVIIAGLRLLNERDEEKLRLLREDLLKAADQLKNGEGRLFDAERIKELGREKAGLQKGNQ